MKNPLITVVVPTYNVEKYISECLDSLIYQTYENLEIIIVDDCCTDGTSKVYARYAKRDSRIKIIKHKENQGVGATLNTGLAAAKGYFHSVVSPDDSVDMFYYQRLVERWCETGSDIIMGSTFRARIDDAVVVCNKKITAFPFTLKLAVCFSLRPGITRTQMRRKSWLEANKRIGKQLRYAEDIMFRLCDSYFANHVSTCPDAVHFYYNKRSSSLVNSTPQAEIDATNAHIKLVANQFFKDKGIDLNIDDDVDYLWRWFNSSVWYIKPFLEANGMVVSRLLKADCDLWATIYDIQKINDKISARPLRKALANFICMFVPSKRLRHKLRSFIH